MGAPLLTTLATRLQARTTTSRVWREQPATLSDFVTSPHHLGLQPLYAAQADAMLTLFGADPKLVFAEPLDLPARLRRVYQAAVLLWGKGSGKDYLCSIVVCWCVHILLCLENPHTYLELAAGEPIDIVNVAYNAQQSKRVFFAKLKARVERWPWLTSQFNVIDGGRRRAGYNPARETVIITDDMIEFPRQIRAWSRHAENESYEGLNILVWVMDEASAFVSKLKRENAEAIYQTLRTSAGSRFGRRWVGFIISYPRHADDFTMTKLREAQDRPELGMYADGPRATWEVNERTRLEPRVRVRDREVPVSLANDFNADYEEALSRYCCEPPRAREAFFRFPQHLWHAVRPGRVPLIEWQPIVTTRTDGESGETRRYAGVQLTELRDLPATTRLYMHGDPGLVNDSFALAIGHATAGTVLRQVPASEVLDPVRVQALVASGELPSADTPVDWETDVVRTVIDALIVWRPSARDNLQVDLQNVEDVIFELKARYPTLGHWPRRIRGETSVRPTVTFDHWQAALTEQRMRSRRMNVKQEAWTRDYQVQLYRNARTQFYNGLVDLPDTPSVTSRDPAAPGALHELERVEFLDGTKIDHPVGGSKDLGDALVRVVQHCTEHNRGGMAFTGMFGHRSMYDTHAPMIASTVPTVNPDRPEPVLEPLLPQERLVRAERPLGELEPASGTIRPSRLAFGSVNKPR